MQDFVLNLLSTGRVELTSADAPHDDDVKKVAAVLAEFEPQYRDEMPGTPPACDVEVAGEASRQFYMACQFHVFRFLGDDELQSRLNPQFAPAETAAAHYSVDLIFRFLPDLVQTVRAASPDDPLLKILMAWAAACPLSSVGIPDVELASIEPVIGDTCLRQMYVDRILKQRDERRLNDDRVCSEVKKTIGAFPELAGRFIEYLNQEIPADETNEE